MIDFTNDNSLFFNPNDFGVTIEINGDPCGALFDYETKEDGDSTTRCPILTMSADDARSLIQDMEVIVKGHGNTDKIFKIRNIPNFSFDDEIVTIELIDIDTATYDSYIPKYLP